MRRLFWAGALLLAMLIPAASANAALTGEYARFETCPTANAAVDGCVYAETNSGNFTMGAKSVPLKNQVVLKGGFDSDDGSVFGNLSFIAPTDGVTLSKSPQPVPGGLTGVVAPSWWPSVLRDLFNETINNGFTGVTATVELAAPASAIKLSVVNELFGTGTALSMPVKVKLSNPFLGSNCYIGSNSNPITLNLTSGTTSPRPRTNRSRAARVNSVSSKKETSSSPKTTGWLTTRSRRAAPTAVAGSSSRGPSTRSSTRSSECLRPPAPTRRSWKAAPISPTRTRFAPAGNPGEGQALKKRPLRRALFLSPFRLPSPLLGDAPRAPA